MRWTARIGLVALAAWSAGVAHGQTQAGTTQSRRPPEPGAVAKQQCMFMPGTVIPRLAMGVCKPEADPEFRSATDLELWETPSSAAGAEPVAVRPLFTPLYVYEERSGGGTKWYRLGDAYAANGKAGQGGPLGWVDGRRLHFLKSRYGYGFRNLQRDQKVEPVQLFATKKAAYAALEALEAKPASTGYDKDVLVAERAEEGGRWDPLSDGGVPPFIELAEQPDQAEAAAAEGVPDTTFTFKHPRENRLIRLGAVCGGPIKSDELVAMRGQAKIRPGIEISFVIDETLSMQEYFEEVAKFIDANLAIDGNTTNLKIAISWYSDWPSDSSATREPPPGMPEDPTPAPASPKPPPGVPNDPGPLVALVADGMTPQQIKDRKKAIVDRVKEHEERPVPEFSPLELVFDGIKAAIDKAEFTPGAHAMVFVIGDAGDRTEPEKLQKEHYAKLKDLIVKQNLQLAFIQVGDPSNPDRTFISQADDLRKLLPPDKQDLVITQPMNEEAKKSLAVRIADIQARMEKKRKELLREISRIESRNCYTEPGPAMEQIIKKNVGSIDEFDEKKLQYFAPAYGWLYHPQQPKIEPQLREFVFMAEPEVDALVATLNAVAEQLEGTKKFDANEAVQKLAKFAAEKSTHSQVKGAIERAWSEMPKEEQTFGRFLEEKLGLRVRNPILYHGGSTKPNPVTTQAAGKLRHYTEQLVNARKPVAWYDAWLVLP